MRQMMIAVALFGALTGAAYAAQAPATHSKSTKPASTSTASHSVTGVVKSMDSSSLTVTPSGKGKADLVLAMNPSTQKDGQLAVGSTVSVRYKEEGGSNVATAIKASPAHASKPKK